MSIGIVVGDGVPAAVFCVAVCDLLDGTRRGIASLLARPHGREGALSPARGGASPRQLAVLLYFSRFRPRTA